MKRIDKQTYFKRAEDILRNNDGASIVLVTIIAIIIIVGVIILSMNSSTLLAFADKQYNKDQAYEAATSLGMTIDEFINKGNIDLEKYALDDHSGSVIFTESLNNIEVTARVDYLKEDTYVITVNADSHGSVYVFSATYTGTGTTYMRVA